MLAWWAEFSKRPLVAHLLRTIERFNLRGGPQLSAAIAYFSVLSMVPVLMLAFSLLGMTLTVLMPEALETIKAWIAAQLDPSTDLAKTLLPAIEGWLAQWATVLVFALVIGFWAGSGWVGNLKRAVRLIMRSDVDNPGKLLPLPLDMLSNFAGLIALFVGVGVTFALSSSATTLFEWIGGAIGIYDLPGWAVLLRLVGLLISFAAGAGLFWLMFVWFTPVPLSRVHLWIGAGVGSAGLLVLQLLAGYLLSAFSQNRSAQLFGWPLVLMLFLNLFAMLFLFIAAWLATQAVPEPEPEPEPVRVEAEPEETKPGQLYVSARVAEKSLGTGLKTGYVVGTATGIGLGALLVGGLRALFGRKR